MNLRLWLASFLVALCIVLAQSSQAQVPPVSLTWNYDAQQKTLTLHLTNNSGKDITAYNISMAEKYTDGTTNPSYAEGIPAQHSRSPANGGFGATDGQYPSGNGTFAAGTTRDQVIPEQKDMVSTNKARPVAEDRATIAGVRRGVSVQHSSARPIYNKGVSRHR